MKYISALPICSPSVFLRKRRNHFPSGRVICVGRGRDAIWCALKALGISEHENILFPASLCSAIVEPVEALGLKGKYYPLNRKLQYNVDDIASRIDSKTRAVFVIHYYGFPQISSQLKELCANRNIKIIEDCALCMMNDDEKGIFGHMGDMAIYSLRKLFPMPDGACLKFNNLSINYNPPQQKKTLYEPYRELLKMFVKDSGIYRSLQRLTLSKYATYKAPHSDVDNVYEYRIAPFFNLRAKMSRISKMIYRCVDFSEIKKRRRENYLRVHDCVSMLANAKPLYSKLPDCVVPYSYPIIVEDPWRIKTYLYRKNIYSELSVNAPIRCSRIFSNSDEQFTDIQYLAKHVISVPVHQKINASDLKYIMLSLRETL